MPEQLSQDNEDDEESRWEIEGTSWVSGGT